MMEKIQAWIEKRIVSLDMERSNCYDPYLTCLRHWCFHRLYGR